MCVLRVGVWDGEKRKEKRNEKEKGSRWACWCNAAVYVHVHV